LQGYRSIELAQGYRPELAQGYRASVRLCVYSGQRPLTLQSLALTSRPDLPQIIVQYLLT